MIKRNSVLIQLFCILCFVCSLQISAKNTLKLKEAGNLNLLMGNDNKNGAYYTGKYNNLYAELLGKDTSEIKNKVKNIFDQLFYGNDSTQRIYYYPAGSDMAYILDVNNNDVRTEGMSYGMMIAVQLDKKEEFDKLWKWAATYMQHKEGAGKDYFSWHCNASGQTLDSNSASDGEEWFVMSLLFAAARWGDGSGIFNYKAEAQKILDAMLSKNEFSNDKNTVTNMFSKKHKQVVFVPVGDSDDITDPSYHLPHFYELWSLWAAQNNTFWKDAADTSRAFIKKAANPVTGLCPGYSNFDGSPADPWMGGKYNYEYDAWRVAMNIAIDYEWFARDEWEIDECNKILEFFHKQGLTDYGNIYSLDGKLVNKDHSAGIVAMNAAAALAATTDIRKEFVEALWNTPIPSGRYRYYDGMLYMLATLQLSGNFRIYNLSH